MGFGRWIGGVLGYMLGGWLGAFFGYVIGGVFDGATADADHQIGGDSGTYGNGGSGYGGSYTNDWQQTTSSRAEGQRNSFLFSMMVLTSYVIQADIKIMHSEMEFVRQFLRANYGAAAESEGDSMLKKLFTLRKSKSETQWRSAIKGCCEQIRQNMPSYQRLQLLAFLVEVAKADGAVVQAEISILYELAAWLGVSSGQVDQLNNLGGNSLDEAYKVLGITKDATDDEVKQAYRRMALKYHPDRVQDLGEDVKKQAEETFKKITAAKEKIYAARGIK